MMDRQQTLLLFAYALIVLINADDRTDDRETDQWRLVGVGTCRKGAFNSPGSEMPSVYLPGGTGKPFENCQKLCEELQNCVGASFRATDGWCSLFGNVDARSDVPLPGWRYQKGKGATAITTSSGTPGWTAATDTIAVTTTPATSTADTMLPTNPDNAVDETGEANNDDMYNESGASIPAWYDSQPGRCSTVSATEAGVVYAIPVDLQDGEGSGGNTASNGYAMPLANYAVVGTDCSATGNHEYAIPEARSRAAPLLPLDLDGYVVDDTAPAEAGAAPGGVVYATPAADSTDI
eukprot:gene11279-368_t